MTQTLIAERGDESIRVVLGDTITATGDFGEKSARPYSRRRVRLPRPLPRPRKGMGAELLGTAPAAERPGRGHPDQGASG